MVHKKQALLFCLAIVLDIFVNNLPISSSQTSCQEDLSEIISKQIYRITQLIEQTRASSNPYKSLQIKYLENKKDTIINIWRAQDRTLLLKQLPTDLQVLAMEAKIDFATPVLDTRQAD